MTSTKSDRGFFVSDLHLFARRSTGSLVLPELREKMLRAHTLVLGGDIFDFKWSTYDSDEISVQKAIQWIEDRVDDNPECKIHYLLGNHDSRPDFVGELELLATRRSSFRWHRYYVRLDHCLFLHGDVADGALDHSSLDLRREKFERQKRKTGMWHTAYDLAVRARLHQLAVLTVRESVVVARISDYVRRIGYGPDGGVRDIYFGHTHKPIEGLRYKGQTYHNGGAAIRGMPFRIITTSLESSS